MNRSDSYKSAVDAQPPPRPPPPQLARVDERNEFGAFNLIDYYLNERANEYTQPKQIRVVCGTFNVNGKEPPAEGLDAWLGGFHPETELFAIGFQELQLDKDAYTGQYLRESSKFIECQERWREAVSQEIALVRVNPKLKRIREERLVGIYLLVFANEDVHESIKNVQVGQVGVGILGYIGNKGAAAIRLSFNEAQICFVCSHLAAHQNEIEKRNRHFWAIVNNLRFPGSEYWFGQHTHIVWLGDLNYRIDLDNETTRRALKDENLKVLMENDQLKKVRLQGAAFHQFREADITFRPTYKFDPGTSDYDTSPKNRIPAWTDRILYHAKNWADIEPVSYRSHDEILFSDHKPVSAEFAMTVRVKDECKYREIHREVICHKSENELLPSVSLSTQHCDFGQISFDQTVTRIIRLQNTGKVPALYQIKDSREAILNQPGQSKELLRQCGVQITPTKGIIPHKGENNFATIQLSLNMGMIATGRFNRGENGKNPLEEIILLVQLGDQRDEERPPSVHYITLQCNFTFSCFGMPRKVLCLKGSQRPCSTLTYGDIESFLKEDDSVRGNFIPLELWKLLDDLHRRGMSENTIFRCQGSEADRAAIIKALDGGVGENLHDVELPGEPVTVAEVLLLFLNSMPEPIVPYSLYELCINNADNAIVMGRIKSNFPAECQTLFEYLTSFLKELVINQENGLEAEFLARKFCSSMLRPDPARNKSLASNDELIKASNFILNFIRP